MPVFCLGPTPRRFCKGLTGSEAQKLRSKLFCKGNGATIESLPFARREAVPVPYGTKPIIPLSKPNTLPSPSPSPSPLLSPFLSYRSRNCTNGNVTNQWIPSRERWRRRRRRRRGMRKNHRRRSPQRASLASLSSWAGCLFAPYVAITTYYPGT